jgi:hypothetical protein
MDQDHQRRILAIGVEQFNAGDYFQAHETWEEIWREVQGRHKMFYQGLIQLAVALHHNERGNHRGAEKLIATARLRWADLPEKYQGLDLQALLHAVGRRVEARQATAGPGRDTVEKIRIHLISETCDP